MRRLLAMAVALLPLPAAAQSAADGRPLAERWCMACHVIEREAAGLIRLAVKSAMQPFSKWSRA